MNIFKVSPSSHMFFHNEDIEVTSGEKEYRDLVLLLFYKASG